MYKINHANIKEWAKNYDGPLFDGILCDPPYELGFMGKSWDSSGIAFDAEMWADIYKLLKPGGHLLAFSGSRTYHRMAVAIEDAGFEIRDQLIWMYGSGFPKSLNIGKAVDKLQGNEREIVGEIRAGKTAMGQNSGWNAHNNRTVMDDTKGTTPYEGYGTALKPAHEPCVLARKPLGKGMTVANNVLTYGTGGLNIDGTRIKSTENLSGGSGRVGGFAGKEQGGDTSDYRVKGNDTGRFPANLIHDGSDEVEAVFPTTGDSSASRYFYTAKASKLERNAGLEDMPLIHPGEVTGRKAGSAGAKNGGYAGMTETPRQNVHPTVKPLALTKYLATLIKPPTGCRLLVPFSGSGSEMIGALQAGWEYVEGVELTEEYIPIAEARIKYWVEQKEVEETKPKQVSLI